MEGRILGQIHHGTGLEPAVPPVHDNVHALVQLVRDVLRVTHGRVLVGQLQRGAHYRLTEQFQ
jgi:hypothetical protein